MVPVHLFGMPYGTAQFFAVTGKVCALAASHPSKTVKKGASSTGMRFAKCGGALFAGGREK